MSNASRIAKTKVKKEKAPRAKKVKIDLNSLPDAVVGGKLIVPVNGKVVFVRLVAGKSQVHEGHVAGVNEDTGDLTLWDDTKGQYWLLNLKQELPVIKVIVSPIEKP